MPIAHITVAGAVAVISRFNKSLVTRLKRLSDYKEFPSKSQYTSKGPKVESKHNCDLPQNTQFNCLFRALRAPLQELLQHGGKITFALQDTKSSCHATVIIMESYAGNLA